MHVDRPKLEIIEIEIMEGAAMACFYLEMLGTFGTRWTKDGENEPVCYRRAGLIALFARWASRRADGAARGTILIGLRIDVRPDLLDFGFRRKKKKLNPPEPV